MAAGYSRRHAERLFKEYTGKSIQEYIQAVRLTKGAGELLKGGKSVLEIALDSHFRSHEGFTRSFHRRFRLTPSEYRERKIAIPWFTQYPVSHYYAMIRDKEETDMENKDFGRNNNHGKRGDNGRQNGIMYGYGMRTAKAETGIPSLADSK